MKVSTSKSKTPWYDGNFLAIWACFMGALGFFMQWESVRATELVFEAKEPSSETRQSYRRNNDRYSEGTILYGMSIGLFLAARQISGLRKRVRELENQHLEDSN
jgi:hypothetical protein